MIERVKDWDQALSRYLTEQAELVSSGKMPVAGDAYCALFAAGATEAMTGFDPAKDYRGRYKTLIGGLRLLRKIGGGTLDTAISGVFSDRSIGLARRGDWALFNGCVGVVIGGDAVFVGEVDGLPKLWSEPRANWQKAWRVG